MREQIQNKMKLTS